MTPHEIFETLVLLERDDLLEFLTTQNIKKLHFDCDGYRLLPSTFRRVVEKLDDESIQILILESKPWRKFSYFLRLARIKRNRYYTGEFWKDLAIGLDFEQQLKGALSLYTHKDIRLVKWLLRYGESWVDIDTGKSGEIIIGIHHRPFKREPTFYSYDQLFDHENPDLRAIANKIADLQSNDDNF